MQKSQLSLRAATTEAHKPRACTRQPGKPHRGTTVKSSPRLLRLESPCVPAKTHHGQMKWTFLKNDCIGMLIMASFTVAKIVNDLTINGCLSKSWNNHIMEHVNSCYRWCAEMLTVVCGEMLTMFSEKTLHTIVWKIEVLERKTCEQITKICQSLLVVG